MFTYQPIYQGEPIQEMDQLYKRAAEVYDKNLTNRNLIDTAFSQIKVPEGGKEYMNIVKQKLDNSLKDLATDVVGGKRWDLATTNVTQMAKTLTNDPNITFLKEQQTRYDKSQEVKEALAAKGERPLFFGDDWDTYKPFDKEGKQKRWKGVYAPKGDYDKTISDMVSVIKPDEWKDIGASGLPGYFEKTSLSSNVKKINDQVNSITDRYLGTSEGLQQKDWLRQQGFTDKEIYNQVKKHVQQIGGSYKVTEQGRDLDYDQGYGARLRAAGKSEKIPTNAINDVFGTDPNEIGEDGPKLSSGIPKDAFDTNGKLKDTVTRTTGSIPNLGNRTDNPLKEIKETTSEHKKIIDEYRASFPDFKINGRRPTDQELAEEYNRGLESFGASVRTTAKIKDERVAKSLSYLGNFDSYLDRSTATLIGSDPHDTKTLRAQIKAQKPDFDFSDVTFKANEINAEGFSKERGNTAGGIIGTAKDKKGNIVRVMVPLAGEDSQRHFGTFSNAVKSYKGIKNFGRGKNDTTRGVGQRVEDSSGLANGYIKKALSEQGFGEATVSKLGGMKYAFRPHRFAEEIHDNGSYGSHSGIKQEVRFGLEYQEGGKWHAVVPGNPLYDQLSGVEVNGHSITSDWSLADMRDQSLTSFRSDGLIENSLKNQKNRDNQPEE